MEEQFALRWKNFHQNLSVGFQKHLLDSALVDVTIAAEGKFLHAHRLVLSVCSPYFNDLFSANPCKHPIVILKDVQYKQLSDILTFMYHGEVNIQKDDLTGFIQTAELLHVRGLAEEVSAYEEAVMKNMQSTHLQTSDLNNSNSMMTEDCVQEALSYDSEASPIACNVTADIILKEEPLYSPENSQDEVESGYSQDRSRLERVNQNNASTDSPDRKESKFAVQDYPLKIHSSHLFLGTYEPADDDESSHGSNKRLLLDLDTKMKVIQGNEHGKMSVKQLMTKFNIGKSQVYEILKAKTEIKSKWMTCNHVAARRKVRKTGNEDINEIVWEWFSSARSRNIRVSGAMVQEYARQVGEQLGKKEFKASNGWLECFRKRHQIVFSDIFNGMADV